ncbi:MAG: hypothetical protein FJ209_07305 [Betaproteobacteria bacterium]|nr:hypothetical protein [Betaproteobacteria bacterium]
MSNEDLQRLVEVAQLITSARDAMSDDIVNRLSWALSEGLILLDRVTRNEGLMRLMQVLEKRESQFLLAAYAEAIDAAGKEIPTLPPAVGGLGCILRVMRDPGVLEGVRLFSLFGKHLSHSMREQHRKGEEAIP